MILVRYAKYVGEAFTLINSFIFYGTELNSFEWGDNFWSNHGTLSPEVRVLFLWGEIKIGWWKMFSFLRTITQIISPFFGQNSCHKLISNNIFGSFSINLLQFCNHTLHRFNARDNLDLTCLSIKKIQSNCLHKKQHLARKNKYPPRLSLV